MWPFLAVLCVALAQEQPLDYTHAPPTKAI
jgi:hypothetical protein